MSPPCSRRVVITATEHPEPEESNVSLWESEPPSRRCPRNYRVRLSRFGSHAPGDFKPSPITVHVTASSSMQARTNAQASHPDYTVTDVMEA